jgi:hypothetical protein
MSAVLFIVDKGSNFLLELTNDTGLFEGLTNSAILRHLSCNYKLLACQISLKKV